jgi:hypothetical protein
MLAFYALREISVLIDELPYRAYLMVRNHVVGLVGPQPAHCISSAAS